MKQNPMNTPKATMEATMALPILEGKRNRKTIPETTRGTRSK